MTTSQIASEEGRERVDAPGRTPGEPAGRVRGIDTARAADLQRQRAVARAILRQAGVRVRSSEV